MTISVLNEILVNLASNDFRVNQAYAGDVYDINTKENRFGCFVATPMTATRNEGGVITYHYVMYYIDRLTDDEANMDLIQTDAVNVLKRVIDSLGYNGIEMGDGYQFTLFKHQFDDWCAGAFVDIDFIVPDMDCEEFEIGKEVDLRPIAITANGTYLPDGFDGFSSVFVNVEGGSDVTKKWVEDYVTSQGYLTEHQPLKTINHISLIGEGNIDIEGGGVTEEWVDGEIDRKTQGFATKEELAGKANRSEIPTLPSYLGDNKITITEGKYSSVLKGSTLTINSNGTERIRMDGGSGYHYGGTRYGDGLIWFNNKSETLSIADIVTKSSIWTGTQAQWDALTDAQRASYIIALITE